MLLLIKNQKSRTNNYRLPALHPKIPPMRYRFRLMGRIHLPLQSLNPKPIIMKRRQILLTLVSAVIILAACKKAVDGANGPAGPAGTANVKYSEWFTPTPYIKDTVYGVWGFKYNKAAPAITQQVLDSGTVLTFGKLLGYNSIAWPVNQIGQLPITVTYQQGGLQNDTWQVYPSVGNLRIRFQNDHNIYTSIANNHQFRYIIIPGGLPAGRGESLDYHTICQLYNIPE